MIDFKEIENLTKFMKFDHQSYEYDNGRYVHVTQTNLPGTWKRWIKSKCSGGVIQILEIREINGADVICLISRIIERPTMDSKTITDMISQEIPYTSDEDFKKFEMYNEA